MRSPESGKAFVLAVFTNFGRKLWLQRHLIWNFVLRDLKGRYVGSLMGLFWSVIHPIVLLVSYTFVFSIVFKIRPVTSATDNFALFLFCGILPWLYFQDTLVRCSTAVVENGNLLRKAVFPAEILPLSLALSNLVTHLLGFLVLAIILALNGLLGWTLLFVPVYLVLLFFISLGVGWLLAAMQVFVRDTIQVVQVLLIFWFWFTPVFYSVELVPAALRPFIRANPMTHVVEGYRSALLEHVVPTPETIAVLGLFAAACFLVGGAIFRGVKRDFVDVL